MITSVVTLCACGVQMQAALGPLPPHLRRAPGPGGRHAARAGAAAAGAHPDPCPQPPPPWRPQPAAAVPARSAGGAGCDGRGGGLGNPSETLPSPGVGLVAAAAPGLVPRRGPLPSWAEALPPLGRELAAVSREAADLVLRLLDYDAARCSQTL